MKQSKIALYTLSGLLFAGTLTSCVSEGNDTGIEYAPNMYVSEAYDAYTQTDDQIEDMRPYHSNYDGMTMRKPVKGTIARGQMDYYMYEEGYEESVDWTNPLPRTESHVTSGMALYNTYCWHCHGKTGNNDGPVVKNSEYPVPAFAGYSDDYIKNLPDGKVFHTITYGKGLMGAHGSVLTPNERWQLVHYIRKLSLGDEFATVSEEGTSLQDMIDAAEEGVMEEGEVIEKALEEAHEDVENEGAH